MGSDMSYMQHLAKGAGQGSPPFWIIAIGLIVLVGVVFLLSRARRRQDVGLRPSNFDGS